MARIPDDTAVPGPSPASYFLVHCPRLNKQRSSLLCMTVCYDTSLATNKVRESRDACSTWAAIKEAQKELTLPESMYIDEPDY